MTPYYVRQITKLVMFASICVLIVIISFKTVEVELIIETELKDEEVQGKLAKCWCTDENGNSYNFCYRNPNNSNMIGRKFDCKHMKAVKELGLLDGDYIDLSRDKMPDPQFVTAISANHIAEGRRQLKNLHSLWPRKTIVVYDMGLREYRNEYESDFLVDLRDFPFEMYPEYVKNLKEYRWKPIIIAKTLKEFGAIFYIDSSVTFKYSDLSPVYNLISCQNKNKRVADVSHSKHFKSGSVGAMSVYCDKFSYLFHSDTFHSIFATTQAGTYDYLPISKRISTSFKMSEANMATVIRTEEAVENIVKWSVLCALEKDCMGPPGAKLSCSFRLFDALKTFAGCHRYDQSVVNILAANLFNGDTNMYRSESYDYFKVERDIEKF